VNIRIRGKQVTIFIMNPRLRDRKPAEKRDSHKDYRGSNGD
jgi:hypothetical protein